jgi:dienelactone hydrolase
VPLAACAAAAATALVAVIAGGVSGAGAAPTIVAANATPTDSPTPSSTATASPTATSSPTASAVPTVATKWLRVVDTRRWTVSNGHVLAHSRTLWTLVLRPSSSGAHPLVVFCHGFDITPYAYLHLLRHWAAAGFVVAAPYFPLTRSGAGRWLDENDVVNQPRDVSVVITAVTRALGTAVDARHVVVAGHSDGGSTAFAVGFKRRQADPRVTAIMAFSADRWGSASQFGAPARRLPLLLVQSDHDEFNPVASAAVVWAIAHRPKLYLHLHGARHLPPFALPCRWRPIVEAVTTDFLRAWTAPTATVRTQELRAADVAGTRSGLARVTDKR